MDELLKYFPHLEDTQIKQFASLFVLYKEWNAKINVISRKDIDNLYLHHIIHSLAIAKYVKFVPDTTILDFGTGGGFPGIPLAIMFPKCKFKLIDGTAKKIRVATEVANAIGLHNVSIEQMRGEDEKGKYDFVVSRAVMPTDSLMRIVKKNFAKVNRNALPNGLLCLKGGELEEELSAYKHIVDITPLSAYFTEDWFDEKKIVYIPC